MGILWRLERLGKDLESVQIVVILATGMKLIMMMIFGQFLTGIIGDLMSRKKIKMKPEKNFTQTELEIINKIFDGVSEEEIRQGLIKEHGMKSVKTLEGLMKKIKKIEKSQEGSNAH